MDGKQSALERLIRLSQDENADEIVREDPEAFRKLILEVSESMKGNQQKWFSGEDVWTDSKEDSIFRELASRVKEAIARDTVTIPDLNELPYVPDIASYIDKAIAMHLKAIPHREVRNIMLLFSSKPVDRIEPVIRIHFDTQMVEIELDRLWESKLPLDEDLKKECAARAEAVWREYRPTVDGEQLCHDMTAIGHALAFRCPEYHISCALDAPRRKERGNNV